MKIVHFNDYKNFAGAETAVKMLMQSHAKIGMETFLVTCEEVGRHSTLSMLKLSKCRSILEKTKPDIVHIHNTVEMGLNPAIAAKELGIPLVWTLHDYKGICPNTLFLKPNGTVCDDMNCPGCSDDSKVVRFDYDHYHALLKESSCVVASDYVKWRYSPLLDARRIYWDADPYLLGLNVRPSFNSRDILFGGRVDNEKGLVFAIAALKRVIGKYPDARLVFAGKARDESIRQLSRIYGVEDHVLHYGYLPWERYVELFQAVNCVICPSIWEEPFNLTLLEAMAFGKPAVATRVGGQTEVAGDACILIEPKSSAEIFNAVSSLFSNEELHGELSARAKNRAMQFKDCGKNYKDVYEKALS